MTWVAHRTEEQDMSTNFYAKTPEMSPDEEGLHIGKRSVGWEFLFRAHPDLGLTTAEAWSVFLSRPGVQIVTEYGNTETLDKFWLTATTRMPGRLWHFDDYTDADGKPLKQRPTEYRDGQGFPFASHEFC